MLMDGKMIYLESFGLNPHFYCYFSYSFDPLPGVEDCGQRTENEESLYAPRIAGIIIILKLLANTTNQNFSQQLSINL